MIRIMEQKDNKKMKKLKKSNQDKINQREMQLNKVKVLTNFIFISVFFIICIFIFFFMHSDIQ